MKYLCLDQEYCGYSKRIPPEEPITEQMLNNPFVQCDQCSSSMVLVKNDFYLNENLVGKNEIPKIIHFADFFRSKSQ